MNNVNFLNNTILRLYVEQEAGKEGEPTTFLVRVKTQEEADSLKESLDKLASTNSWSSHTHSTGDRLKTIAGQTAADHFKFDDKNFLW